VNGEGKRWARLGIRVIAAGVTSYLACLQAGAEGAFLFLPGILAMLHVAEAGMAESPASGPVETVVRNTQADPVQTRETPSRPRMSEEEVQARLQAEFNDMRAKIASIKPPDDADPPVGASL
jgi:hypothetical protein